MGLGLTVRCSAAGLGLTDHMLLIMDRSPGPVMKIAADIGPL